VCCIWPYHEFDVQSSYLNLIAVYHCVLSCFFLPYISNIRIGTLYDLFSSALLGDPCKHYSYSMLRIAGYKILRRPLKSRYSTAKYRYSVQHSCSGMSQKTLYRRYSPLFATLLVSYLLRIRRGHFVCCAYVKPLIINFNLSLLVFLYHQLLVEVQASSIDTTSCSGTAYLGLLATWMPACHIWGYCLPSNRCKKILIELH
jgi:hypothetical protein